MPTVLTEEILVKREKKALKQEKQRQTNLLRAKKMHEARIKHILSSDNISACASNLCNINIGCSGWFYWDWRDGFYPAELPTNQWFEHYTNNFKTVELNAPFYSWPTLNTVQSWIRQAKEKKIVYTVKVSELITHIKRFKGTKELIKDFGLIADILGPFMGCFLFQLPPSFHYTPARLNNILSQLEPKRRNVVEFRHASWWNEKVYSAFKETGTIFCTISAPRLPQDLIKTAEDIYIRFHGTQKWYDHNYTKTELAIWAKAIAENKPKHVWVYFNNTKDMSAVMNAQVLLKQLSCISNK